LIPILFIKIAKTGLTELVVQEALEVINSVSPKELILSKSSSPGVKVGVISSFAGAVMTTLLAPATKCALAFSYSVKTPVASTTTSIPRSFQGSLVGSVSLKIKISFPSTINLLSLTSPIFHNDHKRYHILISKLNFVDQTRSLIATISKFG
jgi:hypothetical protein